MSLVLHGGLAPILPNNPPQWTGTPNPSWQAGVGGVFEMANNTFDQEGDALTYTLNAGSAALPTGVTISGSTLVGSASVVEGSTSGIIIDVKDAYSGLIASSAFFIVVSQASPQTSPTLWQDYMGNTFAGEAGALAKNDAWASTIYDYVPRYNPGGSAGMAAIPTIPTYTGAAHQVIVTSLATMNTAIAGVNAGTYREIYVQRGSNCYTGTGSHTTVDNVFTYANPLWIMAYDNVTPANNGEALRTYAPWDAAFADRAACGQFTFENCNYVYLVGLSWGNYGIEANDIGRFNNCNNMTMYRCHSEGWGGDWESISAGNMTLSPAPFPKLIANGGTLKSATVGGNLFCDPNTNNTMIYQCNFERNIPKGPDGEVKCLDFNGNGNKIVSCAFIDSIVVQIGLSGNTSGTVVEDCDCRKITHYDVDGIENPNGLYGNNEGYIGWKRFNETDTTDTSKFGRYYGNRFEGSRNTSPAFDSSPGSGANYYLDSGGGTGPFYPKHRRDMRWNVFEDSHKMPFILQFGDNEGQNHRDSVVRNINYNSAGNTNGVSGFIYSNMGCEIALNTDCKNHALQFSMSFWNAANPTREIQYTELVGNMFIDVLSPISSEAYLAVSGNCNVGYNVWADVNQSYFLNYPVGVETTQANLLVMGDFTYRCNKLRVPTNPTIANGGLRMIPGIVPTSSSLASILTLVPTTGGAESTQLGSKAGYGIDDVY